MYTIILKKKKMGSPATTTSYLPVLPKQVKHPTWETLWLISGRLLSEGYRLRPLQILGTH